MKKHKPASGPAPAQRRSTAGDRLRPWLLAVLAMLLVARPLMPSESVSWLGNGQPLNMLWLSLAIVASLAAVGERGLHARWTATDVAVAGLVFWCAVASLVSATQASPRPAINMLWEWISLGLLYFLVRQLVRTANEARALVSAMIALGVVLSVLGGYQYFVSMPAERLDYERDPEAALRNSGQWFAAGSIERQQFENRLHSSEPTATFALTNSLAGYLAPWWIVTLGIALAAWQRVRNERGLVYLTLLVSAGLMGTCLLLTKSRSGYLATLTGLALLPLVLPQTRAWFGRRALVVAAVGLAVLMGALVVARAMDRGLLADAGKSLGFRLEYWRSSWAMICDHPWLGCGPGNFQDAYTRYKLPQASEEVRDPHNLLFEVWATAGTPAAAALLAVLGCFAWQLWQQRGRQVAKDDLVEVDTEGEHAHWDAAAAIRAATSARARWFVAGGAAAGPLLTTAMAPLVGLDFVLLQALTAILVGAVVIGGLWPWMARGPLPLALVAIAALVLVIHLLASGGISFPGVADTLWLLLALGVNQLAPPVVEHDRRKPIETRPPWGALAAMALAAVGATACYLTAYRPVLALTAALSRAEREEERGNWDRYQAAALEAAEADVLNAEPWQMLAEIDFNRLLDLGDSEKHRQQFEVSLRHYLRLRPQSSIAHRQVGNWQLRLFERYGNRDDAGAAVANLRRAVELYPNSALAHGEYSLALKALGERDEAARERERALELDAEMPHEDKKLAAEMRQKLQAAEASPLANPR